MEKIAEMEAMQEMITDQAENIKRKVVERDRVIDIKKRKQLSGHIKRLEKALIDDLRLYSSTIQKWNKDDQKHEKGYDADNELGFGGGKRSEEEVGPVDARGPTKMQAGSRKKTRRHWWRGC